MFKLRVSLGLFWGCFEVVLGLFWGGRWWKGMGGGRREEVEVARREKGEVESG